MCIFIFKIKIYRYIQMMTWQMSVTDIFVDNCMDDTYLHKNISTYLIFPHDSCKTYAIQMAFPLWNVCRGVKPLRFLKLIMEYFFVIIKMYFVTKVLCFRFQYCIPRDLYMWNLLFVIISILWKPHRAILLIIFY